MRILLITRRTPVSPKIYWYKMWKDSDAEQQINYYKVNSKPAKKMIYHNTLNNVMRRRMSNGRDWWKSEWLTKHIKRITLISFLPRRNHKQIHKRKLWKMDRNWSVEHKRPLRSCWKKNWGIWELLLFPLAIRVSEKVWRKTLIEMKAQREILMLEILKFPSRKCRRIVRP